MWWCCSKLLLWLLLLLLSVLFIVIIIIITINNCLKTVKNAKNSEIQFTEMLNIKNNQKHELDLMLAKLLILTFN